MYGIEKSGIKMKLLCNIVLFICIASTIVACNKGSRSKQITPEVFGVWSDGGNCLLHLGMVNKQLTLIRFTDGHEISADNESLEWFKKSVFTNVNTKDGRVSASFSDGFMMINNNNNCKQALRKIDNK